MQNLERPIVLHRFALSGHCHRVELFLSLLGLPMTLVDVDLTKGEQKVPGFLARNAFGQVPMIEDGSLTLADSNAILVYLASRYDHEGTWLPRDPEAAARVQRWLSVAAGPLAFGPAAARAARLFGRPENEKAQEMGRKLFDVMESEIASGNDRGALAPRYPQESSAGELREPACGPFFAGSAPTLADVALYSYTARAPEGGVSLDPYPNLRNWLARMEALPRFVPMPRTETRPRV